jgi:hypothetical protein
VEADRFLQLGTDPSAWIAKSVSLRRSADVIWESFFKAYIECASKTKDGQPGDADWDRFFGFLESAKFLYGLSAESAFKASILRDRPTDVEFRLTADGAGKIQKVELKQLGVGMGEGHDLVKLAEKAGVFTRGEGEIFRSDSDYVAIRSILEELGEIVVWSGRYPIPIRSGKGWVPSREVPTVAHGHYLRDWLDILLDHFQKPMPLPVGLSNKS